MNPMFERDLLYPTSNPTQPGSVHITVYSPQDDGVIPVVVESKTAHPHTDYLDTIVTIMQTDVFDRIRMDIRKCGVLYFCDIANFDSCVKVTWDEGKPLFEQGVCFRP